HAAPPARCVKSMRSGGLPQELLTEELVHPPRVGLPAGRLHHLAHQETDGLLFPAGELRCGTRVGGDHLIDDPLQLSVVADLLEALLLYDVGSAPPRLEHLVEHFLAGAVADRSLTDQVEEVAQA